MSMNHKEWIGNSAPFARAMLGKIAKANGEEQRFILLFGK